MRTGRGLHIMHHTKSNDIADMVIVCQNIMQGSRFYNSQVRMLSKHFIAKPLFVHFIKLDIQFL